MLASLQALLTSVIDYAGLFPPAQLDLRTALANYVQYRTGPHAWMLGAFVLPAARLSEFWELSSAIAPPDFCWRLSVIISGNLERDLESLHTFSATISTLGSPHVHIEALEFAPLPLADLQGLQVHLPENIPTHFFEIPLHAEVASYLPVLRRTNACAKIRTGSTIAEGFPDVFQLAQAILSFAGAGVAFKATAGLHHPLRGDYRLTYEPDSFFTTMHGFLNVAILSALVDRQSLSLETAVQVLQETSPHAFQFTEDSIRWGDRFLMCEDIEKSRYTCFRSFGSCSFLEPIHDLKEIDLL